MSETPDATRARATVLFFGFAFAVALISFGYLLWGFATDLALGFLIAGGCRSYYERAVARFRGHEGLAAGVVTVAVGVVVAVPAIFLITALSRQAASAYDAVRGALSSDAVQAALHGHGWVGRNASRIAAVLGVEYTPEGLRDAAAGAAGTMASFLTKQINALITNVLAALYHFAMMLVVVFFGLLDGPSIKRRVFDLSPLPDEEEERIVRTFSDVGGAILFGNGVGSALQGALGGMAMWAFGLPSPLFWGAVMSVFAFLPFFGVGVVSVPATIYLLLVDRVPSALGFFAFCTLESVLIENVLKPKLMGSRMQMHSMLIFFAVLGGISIFGIPGLLYGPLVAAFFLTMLDLYETTYRERLFAK